MVLALSGTVLAYLYLGNLCACSHCCLKNNNEVKFATCFFEQLRSDGNIFSVMAKFVDFLESIEIDLGIAVAQQPRFQKSDP
jgi:hypothetical protein